MRISSSGSRSPMRPAISSSAISSTGSGRGSATPPPSSSGPPPTCFTPPPIRCSASLRCGSCSASARAATSRPDSRRSPNGFPRRSARSRPGSSTPAPMSERSSRRSSSRPSPSLMAGGRPSSSPARSACSGWSPGSASTAVRANPSACPPPSSLISSAIRPTPKRRCRGAGCSAGARPGPSRSASS